VIQANSVDETEEWIHALNDAATAAGLKIKKLKKTLFLGKFKFMLSMTLLLLRV